MYSYDRKGVAEKLRVMVGREDCFANLEATGLRVLRVFMLRYRCELFWNGKRYEVVRTIKLLRKMSKAEFQSWLYIDLSRHSGSFSRGKPRPLYIMTGSAAASQVTC